MANGKAHAPTRPAELTRPDDGRNRLPLVD
jgi:hypothetical protein